MLSILILRHVEYSDPHPKTLTLTLTLTLTITQNLYLQGRAIFRKRVDSSPRVMVRVRVRVRVMVR
eukprot:716819-Amorphochlora_amoeboformis.AAC.1